MPTIQTNSHTIFYSHNQVHTSSHLILLHGAGDSHLKWPREIRRLRTISTYAIDLPGHHNSPLPGCQTIEQYAAAVTEFVATMALEKVILLGHSMGGAIAQLLGVQQPPWLVGLILVGTAPIMPVSPAILEQIHTNFPGMADFITKYAWAKNTQALLKGMGRKMLLEEDPTVVYDDFAAANSFDMRQRVSQIKVPTLILGSRFDKMTPLKQSQFLHQHIDGSQLAIIEGAGHYMALEKPREVAHLVAQFVQRF